MFCFLSGHRSHSHHPDSDLAPRQPEQSAERSQSPSAAEQQRHRSGPQQQEPPQQSRDRSVTGAAARRRAGTEDTGQLPAAPQLPDTLLEAHSEQRPPPLYRETHTPPDSFTSPADGDALACNANKDQQQPLGSSPRASGGAEAPAAAGAGHSPGAAFSGRSSPCSSLRGGSRSPSPAGSEHAPERVVIVKVHQARLASQSEQFANELTQHLGICAPACRILRRMVHFQPPLSYLAGGISAANFAFSVTNLCMLPEAICQAAHCW